MRTPGAHEIPGRSAPLAAQGIPAFCQLIVSEVCPVFWRPALLGLGALVGQGLFVPAVALYTSAWIETELKHASNSYRESHSIRVRG